MPVETGIGKESHDEMAAKLQAEGHHIIYSTVWPDTRWSLIYDAKKKPGPKVETR